MFNSPKETLHRLGTCADQQVQRAASEVRLHSIELVGGLATPGAVKLGPTKNRDPPKIG